MNTPPFLIAGALLLWGWRTNWWAIAISLGVLFELSRFVRLRWDFTDKEYGRVFDVCTLLFGGAVIYLRFSEEITRAGFVLFQWAPVVFALMMLVQVYGTREKIPYWVFSWFLRFRRKKEVDAPSESNEEGLNISWCYFGVCLLAAGATNERDPYFYFAVVALCGWAAWATRIRRYSAPVWASCFLLAAAGGYAGHQGWSGLQQALLPLFGEMFARFGPKNFEALHARTSMGEIGVKKGSGKIVLRVKAEAGEAPQLLKQASFDMIKDVTWAASRREFTKTPPENDVTTWTFVGEKPTNSFVRVSGFLPGRRGLLSLPQGTSRVRELPAAEVEVTPMGVVRANDGPGVVSYLAEFSPGGSFEAEPERDADLKVPDIERPVVSKIAESLRSGGALNDTELVRRVEQYFAQNFSYALYHKPNAVKEGTALGRFLTTTRTGHCEYFASATVLLLRELGIPARYAVGWSVQELKKDVWVVRERHAHAWALAWLGERWVEVDTTPGSWAAMEREQASKLEPISDFFSDLWFRFSLWRWLGQKGVISRMAPYLVLPLVAILVWRIFFKKQRSKAGRESAEPFDWPGADSEYYQLEQRLERSGHGRRDYETPKQWLRRLREDGVEHPSLPALVDLHYRYRFDPRGLEALERKQLRALASLEAAPRQTIDHASGR